MNLNKAMQQSKFDTRLVDFNINNGIVTKEEYEQHLQSLQDLSHMSETLRFEGDDRGASSESRNEGYHSDTGYQG